MPSGNKCGMHGTCSFGRFLSIWPFSTSSRPRNVATAWYLLVGEVKLKPRKATLNVPTKECSIHVKIEHERVLLSSRKHKICVFVTKFCAHTFIWHFVTSHVARFNIFAEGLLCLSSKNAWHQKESNGNETFLWLLLLETRPQKMRAVSNRKRKSGLPHQIPPKASIHFFGKINKGKF